ncbi:MAG: thiol:disulfide interchange protein DsbA/DsbL [Deltaproteobacteria bacterium]|jgi:thiol:disulfide interchange protein DsbA|nr:thiol:disulfide interchange protein DsbA/DsbL [Deltaproteobacteria bacterium]
MKTFNSISLSICLAVFFLAFLFLNQAGPAAAQVGVSQNQASPQTSALPGEDQAELKAILKPARFDESDDKIELVVFFWYGCGSCRATDDTTDMFIDSLPPDVRALKLPALFGNRTEWQAHGKLFMVLEALGAEEKLRKLTFDTVQNVNNPSARGYSLLTREAQEAFVVSQGISKEDFNAAYDSAAVNDKMARVKAFLDNSELDAVPGMVVNGRYSFSFIPGPAYYQLAERLINQEKERLAGK